MIADMHAKVIEPSPAASIVAIPNPDRAHGATLAQIHHPPRIFMGGRVGRERARPRSEIGVSVSVERQARGVAEGGRLLRNAGPASVGSARSCQISEAESCPICPGCACSARVLRRVQRGLEIKTRAALCARRRSGIRSPAGPGAVATDTGARCPCVLARSTPDAVFVCVVALRGQVLAHGAREARRGSSCARGARVRTHAAPHTVALRAAALCRQVLARAAREACRDGGRARGVRVRAGWAPHAVALGAVVRVLDPDAHGEPGCHRSCFDNLRYLSFLLDWREFRRIDYRTF